MRPRRLQRATILSMVTGPVIGRSRLPGTEHAALYACSCERNVTICSFLGYLGSDGRNGPAPAFASHRVDRLARGAGIAARGPRQPEAAAERLRAPLSGTPILRVPCRFTSIAAS